MAGSSTPRRGERGLALLAVLWVVALLSVMALDVLAAARREGATAGDMAARARLDAAADAGLALAIHALLLAEAETGARAGSVARYRPGATPMEQEFEGVRLSIAIVDAAGRIDLNQAPPALLARLFEQAAVPRPQAEALAAMIVDWRDEDEVPNGRGGAEREQYRAAGRPVPPRNGLFLSVNEARHLLGMTPDLFERVAPMLTVHGQREAPDPETAGPEVIRALGPTARPTPRRPEAPEPRGGRRGQVPLSPLAGRAFGITVDAQAPEGRRRRDAVVRLTGDPRDPYWVQEYR